MTVGMRRTKPPPPFSWLCTDIGGLRDGAANEGFRVECEIYASTHARRNEEAVIACTLAAHGTQCSSLTRPNSHNIYELLLVSSVV